MLAQVFALASTVVLLVVMSYFMLGSLPLLVLEHDTPLDANFIRGFFHLYYRIVPPAAAIAAVAYAIAGQPAFCAGMVVLLVLVLLARRHILPRMDALRASMTPGDAGGISRFRSLHKRGMLLNAVQVIALGVSLVWLKL